MGPCALTLTDILAWFEIHGYEDLDLREHWTRLFLAADAVWLEYQHAKQEAK